MLHELVHNVQGPHNAVFYKLLDEITEVFPAVKASMLLVHTPVVVASRLYTLPLTLYAPPNDCILRTMHLAHFRVCLLYIYIYVQLCLITSYNVIDNQVLAVCVACCRTACPLCAFPGARQPRTSAL